MATWANLVPHKYFIRPLLITEETTCSYTHPLCNEFSAALLITDDGRAKQWVCQRGRNVSLRLVCISWHPALNLAAHPLPFPKRRINVVPHLWICGLFHFPFRLQTFESGAEIYKQHCSGPPLLTRAGRWVLWLFLWDAIVCPFSTWGSQGVSAGCSSAPALDFSRGLGHPSRHHPVVSGKAG